VVGMWHFGLVRHAGRVAGCVLGGGCEWAWRPREQGLKLLSTTALFICNFTVQIIEVKCS